jgi:hypothetical protein
MYRSLWLSDRIRKLLLPTRVSWRKHGGRCDGVFVAAAIAVSKWDGGVEQLNAERAQERSAADKGLQAQHHNARIQVRFRTSETAACADYVLADIALRSQPLFGVRDGRRETLG